MAAASRSASPVPLVGRARELARLAAVLGAPGGARLAVLTGEPGIGKTSLLDAALAALDPARVTVLRAGCEEFRHVEPFAPLREALAGAGLADDLFPAEDAEEPTVLQTGPDARARAIAAVLRRLETAAAGRPLVLALDDVQWADASTLLALRTILDAAADLPLAIVLAHRPVTAGPELAVLLAAARREGEVIELAPLDADAVAELAASVAGAPPAGALRRGLARCGGNPLLVHEMLAALRAGAALVPAPGGALDLAAGAAPTSLDEVVHATLAGLARDDAPVAVLAALLGRRFTLAELATVAGRSPVDLLPVVQRMLGAGLLADRTDALEFRHDLVREAIGRSVTPGVHAELHATIARRLAADGAPAVRVAEHLVLGPGGRSVATAEVLRAAAADIAPLDPVGAAALLERARDACPASEPLADLLLADLVDVLAWCGRTTEARDRAEDRLRHPIGPEAEVRLRSGLLRSLVLLGQPRAAIPHAARLVELATVRGEGLAGARAEEAVARAFALDLDGALAAASAAVEAGERDGDPMARILGLGVRTLVADQLMDAEAALASGRDAVALADATPGLRGHRLHPHLFRAIAFVTAGDKEAALSSIRRGRELGVALGAVWALPVYHFVTALVHWDTGAWDDLLAEVDAGLRLGDEIGSTIAQVWAHAAAGHVHLFRGDAPAAVAALTVAQERLAAGGIQFGLEWLALAAALARAAGGDPAGARDQLRDAWEAAEGLAAVVALGHFGPDLVRLALACGDGALAGRVVERLGRAVAGAPDNRGLRGRWLRARGLLERDPAVLDEAAAAFDAAAYRVDAARARAEAGELLLGAGDPAGVVRLAAALPVLEAARAEALAGPVRAALAAAGVAAAPGGGAVRSLSGWDALTPSERQVADLVCGGLANGVVAERLGISRRTVEAHLRQVYAKVGVATRLELAVAARRRAS